ncbi:MAG: hypothetical protein LBN29_08095 [Mediterranea sp.]|jgi:hypothetical protein|nr:hypothetical protein [Mediterranea sp.]
MKHSDVTTWSRTLIVGIAALCVSACGPSSKEAYLEQFDAFITEVANNYRSYGEGDWLEKDKEYARFTGEWYDKFKDEFGVKDEVLIKSNQGQWHYYRNIDAIGSSIEEMLNSLDVKGLKAKVEYYIENDMQEDLEKLRLDAKKAGKKAQEALDGILEDLKAAEP